MHLFRKYLLLFMLSACCCIPAIAQDTDTTVYEQTQPGEEHAGYSRPNNTARPTDAEWEQLTTGKAFDYKDKVEFTPEEKKPTEVPGWLKVIANILRFFTTTAGHVILWSLLLLIVGYIIYRIVSGEGKRLFTKSDKSRNTDHETIVAEENLLTDNWEVKLQTALDSNDHRLAIRYSYMLVLQLLQHRNLIRYRQDKTNIEYYRELTDPETRQAFRQIMRQYEYAWYGNYLPPQPAFDAYVQTFNALKNKLGRQ